MINLQTTNQQTIHQIGLTAIIDTALCVGAGGSSGSLADKPIVRTADGRLLIPASQLKGRLRHECEKIARGLGWSVCESPKAETMCPQRVGLTASKEQQFERQDYNLSHRRGYAELPNEPERKRRYHCLICQIFGNPMLPSCIDFNDLICSEPAVNIPEVLRPGVTINRRRKTAEEKKLYFLETSPANLKLPFEGAIIIYPDAPSQTQPLILAALKHIHALGGSKSAGLGWLTWQFDDYQVDDSAWQTLDSRGGK